MKPYYQDELIAVYHGDCVEILPELAGIRSIISDPPYGINLSNGNGIYKDRVIVGDDKPFDPSHLLFAENIILWGGNNFIHSLPIGGWAVWDKRTKSEADGAIGSPFELAWVKSTSFYKLARIMHGGVINADGPNTPRYHDTQKPVALMRWCIEQIKEPGLICDPYCGSGSLLIAAKQFGLRAIGIEIVKKYCEVTANRISEIQPMLSALRHPNKQLYPNCYPSAPSQLSLIDGPEAD